MKSMKKRKCDQEHRDDPADQPGICVIHFTDSLSENFTYLTQDRLNKLHEVCKKRLSQAPTSPYRMSDVCSQVPETLSSQHGYHRDCYQRFTMNLSRLRVPSPLDEDNQSQASTSRPARRSSDDKDKVIFKPDCIFCNKPGRKKIKQGGSWTTEGTWKFEFGGGENILKVAIKKSDEDLLRRIKGYDLFASEAHYHQSCRTKYIQDPSYWRSDDVKAAEEQKDLNTAHCDAFSKVCTIVDDQVITQNEVLRLDYLKDVYIDALDKTKFPNAGYRGENLKSKLERQYASAISFVSLRGKASGRFGTYLVYSSGSGMSDAVRRAYILGTADNTKDVAISMRSSIQRAHREAEEIMWPPTAKYLENLDNVIPPEVTRFLYLLMTGTHKEDSSVRVSRLVTSIGQDLCRAATNGQWKLPKHISLCMALRHMFRSAELTTLLNRLGHSESYSFSLELETALAKMLQDSSALLPMQIIRNPPPPSTFHSDFDNFDQNTASGSIHTSHGIMLQEVAPSSVSTPRTMDVNPPDQQTVESNPPEHQTMDVNPPDEQMVDTVPQKPMQRTRARSFAMETSDLPECYVTQKKSPPYNIRRWERVDADAIQKEADQQNMLWVLARLHSAKTSQAMPGWAGYISTTGDKPAKVTTIDYYPVINCPITEYKAVQECLRYSEEASKEVGQKYILTTFDLGVCMKAYPLIWLNPEKYKHHIVMIGSFHVICAYFKMLGKKMSGTGLADILTEAGLVGSGSLNAVLSGKQYNRAMTCHKTVVEALERLLLQAYMSKTQEGDLTDSIPEESGILFEDLVDSPSKVTQCAALKDDAITSYIQKYLSFKTDVAEGKHGKTAQLWVTYMNHIWLVLELLQAVKTNDFPLYNHCLYQMADIFFSFDGHNYSRYLTFFSVFLANVEDTHPGVTELMKGGAISVARSFVPGSRCAVDKTIEETFMKHAKSHGGSGGCGAGLTGLLSDFNTYQRWVKTTHEHAQFVDVTFAMADMRTESPGGRKHKDLRPAQVQRSERMVQRATEAITGFLNPFDIPDDTKLYSISSGAPASPEIEKDVLMAEELGKKAKQQFITDRLEQKDHFFEPVKKMKLKTLESMSKSVKLRTTQNKVVAYKQHSSVALQLLVRAEPSGIIDVENLMRYPITPVPYSMGTADGFLTKTDKAKGLHYLLKDTEDAPLPGAQTLIIQDGNALFHTLQDIPGNFQQIAHRIYDSMPKQCDLVFSTDMYKPQSVKGMERERRGCGEKLIIRGPLTKKPINWKLFLMNDQNKIQLSQVLSDVWSSDEFTQKLLGRKMVVVVEGHAYLLTSHDGATMNRTELLSLYSTQEETDTRIILYCLYAQEQGYDVVRIRSPDSDVFFIALHHAFKVDIEMLFDTGSGNKKRLVNITELAHGYGQQFCTAVMALHAFTHCDTTSAFKGIGKVRPIKVLQKQPAFQPVLARLGDEWTVPDDVYTQLEAFTCAIYGKARYKNVDDLRYALLKEKCGSPDGAINLSRNIDLSQLPPCTTVLHQHIRRVNYQVAIWKRADVAQPEVPSPTDGNGWKLGKDGKMEPVWFEGDLLPADRADSDTDSMDESDSSSDEDGSQDDFSQDDDDDSDEEVN